MGTYDYSAKIFYLSTKEKEDFEKNNEVFKDKCWDIKWTNAGDLGWVLEINADEVHYTEAIDEEFNDICTKYRATADIYYDTSYNNVDGGGFAKILPTGYVLWDNLGEDELKCVYFFRYGLDMDKKDVLNILCCGHELTPYVEDDNDEKIIENKEEWVKRVKKYVDSMCIRGDTQRLTDCIIDCYSELIS